MGKFFITQGWVTPKWIVQSGPKSNLSEILWMSSLPASLTKLRSKKEVVIDQTTFSPLKVNGSFRLPWKPGFSSDLPPNHMQPFPHPNDASNKIWSRFTTWPQRYSSLKVWTTDSRPVVYYKLTLWACGSGELITLKCLVSLDHKHARSLHIKHGYRCHVSFQLESAVTPMACRNVKALPPRT